MGSKRRRDRRRPGRETPPARGRDVWPCWLCGGNLYDVALQPGDTITVGLHPLVGSIILCPRCTVEVGIIDDRARELAAKGGMPRALRLGGAAAAAPPHPKKGGGW